MNKINAFFTSLFLACFLAVSSLAQTTTATTSSATPTPTPTPVPSMATSTASTTTPAVVTVMTPTPTPASGTGTAATAEPTPVSSTPVVSMATQSETTDSGWSLDGKKILGISGMGFYDINSSFDSLYFNFATENINAFGFGFLAFFEYGFSKHFSGEIDLGYSRLIYASKSRNVIRENYFVGDLLAHYYFMSTEKFQPYVIFGGGTVASSGAVAPTVDAGIGMHYLFTDEFSLKADVIIKSAVIYNRGEGRVGLAYHF